MKKEKWMASLCLCILMMMCAVTAGAKDRNAIVRGMTKQEVTAVMGKPHTTSFNEYGDRWEYVKRRGGLLNMHDVLVTIEFGHDNRVVRYTEQVIEEGRPATDGYAPKPFPGTPRYGYDGMEGSRLMDASVFSEKEFAWLMGKIRSASFTDNKLVLIEVASMKGYYTSRQCAQMLSLFSFSEERMRVLSLMASHIVDPHNNYDILKLFTFDSDKDKAARILQRR